MRASTSGGTGTHFFLEDFFPVEHTIDLGVDNGVLQAAAGDDNASASAGPALERCRLCSSSSPSAGKSERRREVGQWEREAHRWMPAAR